MYFYLLGNASFFTVQRYKSTGLHFLHVWRNYSWYSRDGARTYCLQYLEHKEQYVLVLSAGSQLRPDLHRFVRLCQGPQGFQDKILLATSSRLSLNCQHILLSLPASSPLNQNSWSKHSQPG